MKFNVWDHVKLKLVGLSEIETLTGEDTTERVEMALGQPITSREQTLKGGYRRGNYRIM